MHSTEVQNVRNFQNSNVHKNRGNGTDPLARVCGEPVLDRNCSNCIMKEKRENVKDIDKTVSIG